MDENDLLSLAEEQDSNLPRLLTDLLEVTSTILAEEDFDEIPYRKEAWRQDGAIVSRLRDKSSFSKVISHSSRNELEEADKLKKHLQTEKGFNIDRNYIPNILIDAFGDEAQDLDAWRSKIPEIVRKIESDIVGRPKSRHTTYLGGIEIAHDIRIKDDIWLRAPPSSEKIIYESEAGLGSHLSSNLLSAPCALELPITTDPSSGDERPFRERYLIISLLRVYGIANVSELITVKEPLTYSIIGGRSESLSSRPRNPKYRFNPIDVSRFRNLIELLDPYCESYGDDFSYPVGIAMNHFEESLKRRSSPLSSISFCIIGIESLYRGETEGSTSSNDVARYCAMIMSNVCERWDALQIKESVDRAYEFRNQWAHGDHHSEEDQHILQRRLWDYLRASIVVFAWLHANGHLNGGGLELEGALIDQAERKELENDLEGISLIDYLPVT